MKPSFRPKPAIRSIFPAVPRRHLLTILLLSQHPIDTGLLAISEGLTPSDLSRTMWSSGQSPNNRHTAFVVALSLCLDDALPLPFQHGFPLGLSHGTDATRSSDLWRRIVPFSEVRQVQLTRLRGFAGF